MKLSDKVLELAAVGSEWILWLLVGLSLISVAVAAQIPCRFCLIADTAFAKLSGATEPEIAEALTMASIVRHWSTLMNGLQLDEAGFKRDVDRIVRDVRKSAGR